MRETKPKGMKQYSPPKSGAPFNPKSVEGVQMRRRQAAAIGRRKEEEAEDEMDAPQVAEEERLAKRSFLEKLWDRVRG